MYDGRALKGELCNKYMYVCMYVCMYVYLVSFVRFAEVVACRV